MKLLVGYGLTNVARNGVAKALKYLAYSNDEFSSLCIKWLMQRISTVECRDIPIYLMAIEEVVTIGDEYTRQRVDLFVERFLHLTTKELSESYLPYSYLSDLFIKLALKLDILRDLIKSKPDKFQGVENWFKRNTHPSPSNVLCVKKSRFHG